MSRQPSKRKAATRGGGTNQDNDRIKQTRQTVQAAKAGSGNMRLSAKQIRMLTDTAEALENWANQKQPKLPADYGRISSYGTLLKAVGDLRPQVEEVLEWVPQASAERVRTDFGELYKMAQDADRAEPEEPMPRSRNAVQLTPMPELRAHAMARRLAERLRIIAAAPGAVEPAHSQFRADTPPTDRQGEEQTNNDQEAALYAIQKDGDFWRITYDGRTTPPLADILGLRYIVCLLRKPGEEISALDLRKAVTQDRWVGNNSNEVAEAIGTEDLSETSAETDLGPLANYAPAEIEASVDKLRGDKEQERDPAKQAEIQEKIDQIEDYVRKSKNRWGRNRKVADPGDKARKSISTAIDTALGRIEPYHKDLRNHLKTTIRKGGNFSYHPSPAISWQVS